MFFRFIWILMIPFIIQQTAFAVECSAVFTDGLQNNNNSGEITFEDQSRLYNSISNTLDSRKPINFAGQDNLNCDGVACTHSGNIAQVVNIDDFGNSNTNITHNDSVLPKTIIPGDYNKLTLGTESTLIFTAGDYRFKGDFSIGWQSKINISGTGVVRIFLKKSPTLSSSTKINEGGSANQLLFYSKEAIQVLSNSSFIGFIYSKKDVTINSQSSVDGAISGKNITLVSPATVDFFTEDVDFGDFCKGSVPLAAVNLALYRFEQTDLSTQIDDTSGNNNHAEIPFIGASLQDGKYCRGFDSVSYNRLDYTGSAFRSELDLDEDVGLRGTISFWFNSTVNWNDDFERVLFDASSGSNAADKYFVLEIQQDGRLKFAFEDSADTDFSLIESSTNSRAKDKWYYVTVTWDYVANDFAIYVDGSPQIQQTKNTNGAMGELNKIVVGDNSSDYTQIGNSPIASPYSSRGNFDEVRIYNKVLSQTEIQTDMNDDNGCAAELIAYYQMDELAWSGADDEVLNELGSLHGKAFSGATTDRTNPAREFNPGTCGYGYFDGINDYVQIADDPALDLANALTVSAWIYPTKLPSSGLMTILSKDKNYEFHVTPSGEINWWWQTQALTTTGANIIANDWYHIAITYKDGEQFIYINGEAKGDSTHSGQLILNDDPLLIGRDLGRSDRYFQGNIDEVKIYNGALLATEVNVVYLETHPCDSFIDHFQIDTRDQTGITCQPDEIIIKACADASCSIINPNAVDVQLLIDNIGYKTVTVSGPEGTSTTYPYTKVGNAALSLDQTYECKNGPSTPCNVDFRNAGFIFSTINDQVAGVDFSGLSIQAVKDVNGVCTDLLSGSKTVGMAMEYIAPSRVTTNDYSLSGTVIAKNLLTNVNDYTSIPLNFIASAIADLGTNKYDDAGQVKLYARYVEPPSNGDPGFTIEGSSNAFWVSPHHFSVVASNGSTILEGSGHDSNQKQTAGDNFTLSFIAKNADDDATTNYIAQQAQLQLERTGPTMGGAEGTLQYSNNKYITSQLGASLGYSDAIALIFDVNGEYKFNAATYSEVGLTKLYVRDNNYGSGTYKAEGIANVGRFIPKHFVVTDIFDGELKGTCKFTDSSTTNHSFIYSGQMLSDSLNKGALSYLFKPSLTITAKSSICPTGPDSCTTTKNYTGNFIKLSTSSYDRITPDTDAVRKGKDATNLVPLVASIDVASLAGANGEVTYTYSGNDNFAYLREVNSEISEFTSVIDLSIKTIIDSDDVETLDNEVDKVGIIASLNPVGKLIRFGRAQLENSYGPETSKLALPLSVNYFKDGQYEVAKNDQCTPYNATNMTITNISLTTPLPSVEDAEGEFINESPPGKTRTIKLSAPGAGNTGQVEVIYDISDWLKYDWAYDVEGADGLYNDNPRAEATFGIFRGNDRIIYQREISL